MKTWVFVLLGCLMVTPAWAQTVSAKPGKGITLTTEDEDFQLRLRPRAQLRYTFDALREEENIEHSFSIRRARLAMTGHMFDKRNYFKMELAYSPKDLGFKDGVPTHSPLLDWYSEFRYLRDATVRVGQYKVPFSRQRVISSGDLQMVDRSLAQGEFNVDRDIGLDLRSKDLLGLNLFRYYIGVYMAEGREAFQSVDFDYSLMYLARVEALPFGLCDDYKEADMKEGRGRPCVSIGIGTAFLPEAENDRGIKGEVPEDGGTTSISVSTADVMAKWEGFSLFSETYFRYGLRHPGNEADLVLPRNGYGFTIQGGKYFFSTGVELTSRYSRVASLAAAVPFTDVQLLELPTSLENTNETGVGWSYYFDRGHSLKLQGDLFYAWKDDRFYTGDVQGRVQLQAAF